MNWFTLVIGVLYVCSAVWELWKGNPVMACIMLMYGLSAFAFVVLGLGLK